MRVLVIGASGYVGRSLVCKLQSNMAIGGRSITQLLLLDRDLSHFSGPASLRCYAGSLTDKALLRRVLADGIDVVFHLAGIAGGQAELHYALGYDVNLMATLELLNQLRNQHGAPVFVYTSSVAVYGGNLPQTMDEYHPPCPELSYGAHKLMIETAINDLTRRGEIDGRALRLPGIVARPPQPNGLRSAFMSELMHAVADDRPYICPVSATATAWWMSVDCCVENLLHGAALEVESANRVWQLPVLHRSVADILEALCDRFGGNRRSLISFEPESDLEHLFGRYPPLKTPTALAAGFVHDGDEHELVKRSLQLDCMQFL